MKRQKEIAAKNEEKRELVSNVEAMQKLLVHSKQERVAAEDYRKQLKPACDVGDSTYDERKQARKSEIEALETARDKLKSAFEFVQVSTHFLSRTQRHG